MSKNLLVMALMGALTLSVVTIVTAQDSSAASVEVRVWRNVADPERLHLSTRPAGGQWVTHQDRLVMERSDSGRWDQSSIVTVDVPLEAQALTDLDEACLAASKIILDEFANDPNVSVYSTEPTCVAIPSNLFDSRGHDYYAVGTLFYGDTAGQLKTALWDVCVFPKEKLVPWDDDSGNHWRVADWGAELDSFSLSIDFDGRQNFYDLDPWNRTREMSFIYADAAYCQR